jgi:hypothetical protein
LALQLGQFSAKEILKRVPPLSPLSSGEDLFNRSADDRRTILVGAGENGYLLAGITRYCFRAATERAAIVFVGSDGLMLAVLIVDDDVRWDAMSDSWGFDRIRVEEILTLHNLAFWRLAGYSASCQSC